MVARMLLPLRPKSHYYGMHLRRTATLKYVYAVDEICLKKILHAIPPTQAQQENWVGDSVK